jgi:Fe-S-cluster-containing hydrogenase component 2
VGVIVSEQVAERLKTLPATGRVVGENELLDEVIRSLESNEVTVAVYDGAWSEYSKAVLEIRKRGLNPFLYTPLDTIEFDLASPYVSPDTLVAGKYAASLADMAGKAPTRLSPMKTIDRRSLLTKPLESVIEYLPAPILLNPSICGSWKHCRACIDACPQGALEGKPPTVNVYKCTGCGVCTAVCPFGLLFMPKYNIKSYDYLLDKIRRETLQPGVVVAVCTSMLGELAQGLRGLSAGELGYPVIVVPIHCPGWFTEYHMLLSASRGFDVVIACDDDRIKGCADDGAAERWLEEMEPLGAHKGIVRRASELAGVLRAIRPRSRVLEGVESLTTDKTAAYRIIAAYGVEEATYSTPLVAYPRVDEERCLVCDACSNMCPYKALQIQYTNEERRLVFNAEACTACGVCEAACPYNALKLEYRFDKSLLGKWSILARDEIARCRRCGKPIGSMKHLKYLEKKLRESGASEWVIEQLWLCQECKVRNLIEKGFLDQQGGED